MYRLRCYYSNLFDEQKGRFLITVLKFSVAVVPKGEDCIDLFSLSYGASLLAAKAIASDYPFVTQAEIVQDKIYAE
jgi:hypothetical protein